MEIDALIPLPHTTLVVLLGASEWPNFPDFPPSAAFSNAALGLENYFLQRFGLPEENLINLFDSDKSADDIDRDIGYFVDQRLTAMKKAGTSARDLLIYFVGHGGFVGGDSEYYLAIRRTRDDNPAASGIRIVSLAHTLKEKARFLRRIVILDCCFAAAAFKAFQASPSQTAILKTVDAFKEKGKGEGFPGRGTALLCSSPHNVPSLLLPDGSSTMFSSALLNALSLGSTSRPGYLSLRDIAKLTEDVLYNALAAQKPPRPELHSPDQSEGDVADIPLFPNPARPAVGVSTATEQTVQQGEEKQTISLNATDTVTHVRQLLEQTTARQITLIVPADTALGTYGAWRLLSSSSERRGKEILVLSPNSRILFLARKAQLRTAPLRDATPLVKVRPVDPPASIVTEEKRSQPKESGTNAPATPAKQEKPPEPEGTPQTNVFDEIPTVEDLSELTKPDWLSPPTSEPVKSPQTSIVHIADIADSPTDIVTGNDIEDLGDPPRGPDDPPRAPRRFWFDEAEDSDNLDPFVLLPPPPSSSPSTSNPQNNAQVGLGPNSPAVWWPDSDQENSPDAIWAGPGPIQLHGRITNKPEQSAEISPARWQRRRSLRSFLPGSRVLFVLLGILAGLALVAVVIFAVMQNTSFLIWFMAAGLLAGVLSSSLLRSYGTNAGIEIIAGCIGALIAGYLTYFLIQNASFLSALRPAVFWTSMLLAFIGACILIAPLKGSYSTRGLLLGQLALLLAALTFISGIVLNIPLLPWFISIGFICGIPVSFGGEEGGMGAMGNIVVGCIGACSSGYLTYFALGRATSLASVSSVFTAFVCTCIVIAFWRIASSKLERQLLLLICCVLMLAAVFVFVYGAANHSMWPTWLAIGMFSGLLVSLFVSDDIPAVIGNMIVGSMGAWVPGFLILYLLAFIPSSPIIFWTDMTVALICSFVLLGIVLSLSGTRRRRF